MSTQRKTGARVIPIWRATPTLRSKLEVFTRQEKGHYKHREPGIWFPTDAQSLALYRERVAKALHHNLNPNRPWRIAHFKTTWESQALAALSALHPALKGGRK